MKGTTRLSPAFRLLLLLLPAASALAQASRPAGEDPVERLFSHPKFLVSYFDKAAAKVRLASGSLKPLEEEARKRKTPRAKRVLVEVLRAEGNQDGALKEARELQKRLPRDPESALLCGRLAEEAGKNKEAEAWFRKVLSLKPSMWQEWEARTCLALLFFSGGDKGGALAQLRRIALLDRTVLAASAARVAGLHGEIRFAAEYAGPIQSANRKRRFLSLLQAAHFQEEGGLLDKAAATLARAEALARSPRERRYTAWAQAEIAARRGKLAALVEGWLKEKHLDRERLTVAVRALGSLGRTGEALALLERPEASDPRAGEWVSLLLTFALDAGKVDQALEILQREVRADPASLQARMRLSRLLVDLGRLDAAEKVWREAAALPRYRGVRGRLTLCRKIREAGFTSLASEYLEKAYRAGKGAWSLWAGLEWAGILREGGKTEKALALMEEVGRKGADYPGVLRALGEALERMGFEKKAARVYERVLSLVPGEDLEIHLAWLLPRVGRGREAIELLRDVWEKTSSRSRRRQAEDRLLEISAKEGVLGDLADELETRLEQGKADAKDVSMLVDLYSKIGDTDSVKDVLDQFAREGGDRKKSLEALSRVYLEAGEIRNYEKTLHELLRLDPAHAKEWWMQLAMGALERGSPKDAKRALRSLAALGGLDHAFKAGVLAFAGLHDEAAREYLASLAEDPNQVELWLLVGKELAAAGKKKKALAIFQFLADRPVPDDLFVVAMDGLLNLDAPAGILAWAARRVEERLALRPTRLFLYRLLSDLLDSLGKKERSGRILQEMVPVGAEQRLTVIRELMDLARSSRDRKAVIRYGRMLMALGDVYPPEVYLSLGEALLKEGKWAEASRVFGRARRSLDFVETQRRVARLYLENGKTELALRIYRRLLLQAPEKPSLLVDLASAEAAAGKATALQTWARALAMVLNRFPSREEAAPARVTGYVRNVGTRDVLWGRILQGLASAGNRAGLGGVLSRVALWIEGEMKGAGKKPALDRMPRLQRCLEAFFLLARVRGDVAAAGRMVRRVSAWAGASGKDWARQQARKFLALGWAKGALGFLEALPPAEARALRWRALWMVKGDPPGERPPGTEESLDAVLWRYLFGGAKDAEKSLAAFLAGISPAQRSSLAVKLIPLHLLLGDREAFRRDLAAALSGASSVRGGRRKMVMSSFAAKRLLASLWRILEPAEKQSILEILARAALDKNTDRRWRSLYLDALLASGRPARKDMNLSNLVLDIAKSGVTADEVVLYLRLVPAKDRARVMKAVVSILKGYMLARFLGMVPRSLGTELDAACLEVLKKAYREYPKPEDLAAQLTSYAFPGAGPLRGDVEGPLLEILAGRLPRNLNVQVERLGVLLREGKKKEAAKLAGAILGMGSPSAFFRRDWESLFWEAFRGESETSLDAMLKKAAAGGSFQAALLVSSSLERRGKLGEALDFLAEWSSRHKMNIQVFRARMNLLRSLGRHREALEEYVAWVEGKNSSLNTYWYLNLSSALEQAGRYREAMDALSRYRSGSSVTTFDYAAWNRLQRLVQFPPSPGRDRRILHDLRSYLHPADPRMMRSLAYIFRNPPREGQVTPLMKAALVPGALKELEGVLARLTEPSDQGVPIPWDLYSAVAWGYYKNGRGKELAARLKEELREEPSSMTPLFLADTAAYWMPGAAGEDQVKRGLSLALLSRQGDLRQNLFWAGLLEKTGKKEEARRLRDYSLLAGMTTGDYQTRNLLIGVLGGKDRRVLDDPWVARAVLGFLPLFPPRVFNTYPNLQDTSFLEPWVERGKWKEFLSSAGDLVDWYQAHRMPSLARVHLVLAAGFAGAGNKEEGRKLLRQALREAFSGRAYLDTRWIGKIMKADPEGAREALEGALEEWKRQGEEQGDWAARFMGMLALEMVRSGKEEEGRRAWERALSLAGKENLSLLEDLGESAFREGRKDWAVALLAPIFEKGGIEPGSAARVCSELLSAGVDKSILRKGLESYLPWCPRKDLALLAPTLLPPAEARAYLEKALAERPGDGDLRAAKEKLRAQPVK